MPASSIGSSRSHSRGHTGIFAERIRHVGSAPLPSGLTNDYNDESYDEGVGEPAHEGSASSCRYGPDGQQAEEQFHPPTANEDKCLSAAPFHPVSHASDSAGSPDGMRVLSAHLRSAQWHAVDTGDRHRSG